MANFSFPYSVSFPLRFVLLFPRDVSEKYEHLHGHFSFAFSLFLFQDTFFSAYASLDSLFVLHSFRPFA